MNSQVTAPEVIEQEKQLVAELADLSSADTVVFNDSGWDSRVYSTPDSKYFFKFPRSDKIRQRYEFEIAALKLVAASISVVDVPKIMWEHPDNNYFGYEGVPGNPIGDSINSLDTATRQTIGETYGTFLKQLHELKLPGARSITVEQEIKQFQEWYEPAVPIIQKTFSKAEQNRLKELVMTAWPRELLDLGRDARLCHGDLGFWNLIHGSISRLGVIDFGDVGYYDRSKDFIGLEDPDVFESALLTYGDDEKLRRKIAVREPTTEIISLTFYIKKKDEPKIQKTLEKIRAAIA